MGPKMTPESIPNGAIGGPGAAKGRLCHPPWSIWRVPKIGRFVKAEAYKFSRLLAPLGRFWAPFWAQLGPKGGPKILLWSTMAT